MSQLKVVKEVKSTVVRKMITTHTKGITNRIQSNSCKSLITDLLTFQFGEMKSYQYLMGRDREGKALKTRLQSLNRMSVKYSIFYIFCQFVNKNIFFMLAF